jgi:predicted nucleic acid-binding protein
MRIVVHTNVFVSAVLKANSLPFIVVRWSIGTAIF